MKCKAYTKSRGRNKEKCPSGKRDWTYCCKKCELLEDCKKEDIVCGYVKINQDCKY